MRDTIDFRNVSQELSGEAKELAREVDPEQAQPTQLTSQAFNPGCVLCGHPTLAIVNNHPFCEACAIGYLLNLKAAAGRVRV